MKRLLNLSLTLFLAPSLLSAQSVPFLSGRVNDYAEVLSIQTRNDLEAMLKEHESTTSNQIVVLTIQSLEGAVLEEYSLKVAETWKLGQKGKDNGVLLLISKDDRKLRIEVGYGLEGTLTDATCNSIIRNEIVPHFKDGDYNAGVSAGVRAIIEAIKGSYVAEESGGSDGGNGGMDLAGTLFFIGVFLLVVGTHSVIAILNKGFMSYFHGAFLLPFWTLFPRAFLGNGVGFIPVIFFVIIFIAAKLWFKANPTGLAFQQKWMPKGHSGSSGGGWSSSGGGGFSGGGGSFGGGGSSGSW